MGDVSAEPSMEDILSSIKRIIAEDGDDRPARPRRAPMRAVPSPAMDDEPEEVLELSDPMPPAPPPSPSPSPPPPRVAAAVPPAPPAAPEPVADIVSEETAQATRGALDTLSRLLVKPAPSTDGTLEGLVREMLRPMLRDWLDANLPAMVEELVAREIAKITRGG